jgi:hypothetical protein
MSFYILSPLPTTSGGLGTTVKPTAGQVPIGNADGTYTPGTVGAGTVTSVTGSGNIASSGGTTPNITFTGTLPVANGGTNLSSFTANGIVYATSTSALTTGTGLTFDGNGSLISGIGGSGNNNSFLRLNGSDAANYGSYIAFQRNSTNKWLIGVDSVVNGGTSDDLTIYGASAIRFYATIAEQMRLTSTGLGIGTSSPAQKLSIQGATFVGASFNGQAIGDVSAERIRIGYKNGTPDTGLVPAQIIADTSLLQFASRDTAAGAITFATGSGIPERMRLDSSGNFGIGTSSPATRLNVTGGSLATSGNGILAAGGLTAGRLVSDGVNATINPIHTYFDDRAYEISAGSTSGFVAGVVVAARSFTGTGGEGVSFWTRNTERARIDGSGNVGIGTTANASAILDAQSTTKGVRMPNMTTTQKNAISSPAAGLMVFDTTLAKLCVYSGSAWQTITSV